MADRLFRVYIHTSGDESIHELVVTADSQAQAEARALDHVKAGNQGKGKRTKAQSKKLTKILNIKKTSRPLCLEIHSIPATVMKKLVGK